MAFLSRRQFLKTLGFAGGATLAGCSDRVRHLIPYVVPPEDIVPGEATWYASTCRECPAGCGMLVKNRDGRVIKVEGNPMHPVNTGRLCPRGQASVQGLYNPDRHREPMVGEGGGKIRAVSWEAAEKRCVEALASAREKGSVVLITDLITGAEKELAGRWVKRLGGEHIMYEAFAYESLRRANQLVFGTDQIPAYRFDRADFIISFGANFLETWVSNVEFTRQFASSRAPKNSEKKLFVYVGPRLSMTAASADYWVSVPVGGERFVAMGLLHLLLKEGKTPGGRRGNAVWSDISACTPAAVEERTGVKAETLSAIARHFSSAAAPLAVAEGMAFQDPWALDTAVAVNLLCSTSPQSRSLLDFSDPHSLGTVAPASTMRELAERMADGKVGAVFLYRVNPVRDLPVSWNLEAALRKVPLVVSFSSFPDETGALSHIVMPSHTFLESWGDYSPRRHVTGLLQPAMGAIYATRQFGDILLSTGRAMGGQTAFPEKDFYEILRNSWDRRRKEQPGAPSAETFWLTSVQRGGEWEDGRRGRRGEREREETKTKIGEERGGRGTISSLESKMSNWGKDSTPKEPGKVDFFIYPTTQFFDGRMANRPFLQEVPDPVTMVTWDGWVEVNPGGAKKMGLKEGDEVEILSDFGSIKAPVHLFPGIPEGAAAMPIGNGHRPVFSRYAAGAAENPGSIMSGRIDPAGGVIAPLAVTIRRTGRVVPVARADGSAYQHGRKLARSITFRDYLATAGKAPDIILPLPAGYTRERDFYPPHQHKEYRWAMVVDLDRCIGCQACVVACYAENNVGLVGKDNVLMGRQMSWLHIERYYEPDQPMVRFLPMLCQHCDSAPCESMCPVFAPQHNPEGINNQVYNRCIGTRDCNINCPWKVRRFNWFTWHHDPPLDRQLNPDVTVRQKGVMEKCSFCIQRIIQAKSNARSEGRKVRDGEFTTACAQTCPADAITFGSLLDPESRVTKLFNDPRAYQVLGSLNTKTAVVYLKKITQEV